MIKLYLKTLTLVIILTCLVLLAYQFGFSYLTKENFNRIDRLISKGTFSYIQTVLTKTPKTNWASALQKIQPSDAPLAKILPISTLQLTKKSKLQLMNGDIVFLSGEEHHFSYFLYYGIFEGIAVQRIGNSQFALQVMLTEPINQTIRDTMHWPTHIILRELNNTSEEKWSIILNKLQITFDMPLQLIPSNSDMLTSKMRQDLNTYGIAYLNPKSGKPISTLYYRTSDPQKLLVIGPMEYSPLSSLFSVAQIYYFVSFSVAAIIFVLFLTWLFSRNVLKIYRLTEKYSRGNFHTNTKISHASVLHGVYQNIISMGSSLNRLIQSQRNMTRFVAHEIRTPLSTMQLALDSLEKENNLSEKSQKNLISIQEDIQEINRLVSYFLLYHQSTTHELQCKTENLNLSDWLVSIVKRYEPSKIKVTFTSNNKESVFSKIDPSLLKHALDNLITNALKFAKTTIIVSLEVDTQYIKINVDDDGPGIPKSETKNIFEPFNTLSEEKSFGKHIGLGLTITKSIIELHKGSMVVLNSPELGGVRVSILLPRFQK